MSNKFPQGWNEERVREVLAHYESQTDDEQFAEIEAAQEQVGMVTMVVPQELVPEIRTLIANHRG